ncbi:MAG: ADP-forming succinate--CoA ligase subunit beta [Deltaproteobacteria bacterium]|nr:ADP-forming succinate--CoA ligase subunit beta [Deltaproteobacteria bacterium]MBN2670389.1 ADP-forming succinate--CoA ligase subunit beta [Deltaproteobacteria bacterium]
MKIHEYQAKRLFSRYGIQVPRGEVVFDEDEAVNIAELLMKQTGKSRVVLKAQVHAGGRGKAGGVKIADNLDDVRRYANAMFGSRLVTRQTGGEGTAITRLLVEEAIEIDKELYVSIVIDRSKKKLCIMSSTEGGMDIEEVAASQPEKLKKEWFEPLAGLLQFMARNITADLGLHGNVLHKSVRALRSLADLYIREDCSLVEVNPLVTTRAGEIVALDAKITFDDNAEFRHRFHGELVDKIDRESVEQKARELGFSYVSMDGNIGCCVNGAGLAMATMDIIKLKGGEPANFLDVGGGADADTVMKAFEIILSDPRVSVIFVNIFGGILRCDVVAEGIAKAVSQSGLNVPLVVRLAGTNAKEGKHILDSSGLKIFTAPDMDAGAQLAVEKAQVK